MDLGAPRKALIGMIHVGALPGTPASRESIADLAARAAAEARLYAEHGLDALMIENMHDLPYLAGAVGPEIVAGMTAVGLAVRRSAPLPLGVQVLAAANREALAIALATGAEFIRVENFAFAHVADEGLLPTASAGPLLRYRRAIGAEHVRIWADVKKKHASHAITADISVAAAAHAAEWMGADAVIVTGGSTGAPAALEDVRAVRDAVRGPVLVGSGVTPENLSGLWPHADGFIIGSYLKRDGRWENPLDPARIAALMTLAAELRG